MGVFFDSRLLHSAAVQITSNQPPFFHLPTKKQMEKKCKWTGIRVISFAVCIGTCILKTGTQMHNKKTFIHHSYTPAPPYKHRNAH